MHDLGAMRFAIVAMGAAAAALSTGCGCAGLGAPSVVVVVVDSLTNAPAAAGATLLVYDLDHGGVRADSVTERSNTDPLWGMEDRTGHFSVVVRKAPYRDWEVPEVVVRDGCPSVKTVNLTARLAMP